jgi:signal peptidase II
VNQRQRPSALPFLLSAAILLLDQVSKALVAAGIRPNTIAWSALGDFFWLVHQRNWGIAFSLGDGFPPLLRVLLFIGLPLSLIVAVVIWYFRSDEPTALQRWILAGLVGGGLGNQIDRIFRPDGVVDFLSFKFYGLFGLERWPTFNVADAAVFCSAILLAATMILQKDPEDRKEGGK